MLSSQGGETDTVLGLSSCLMFSSFVLPVSPDKANNATLVLLSATAEGSIFNHN